MKPNIKLDQIIDKFSELLNKLKILDEALSKCGPECTQEYEEEIELWKTYGGD